MTVKDKINALRLAHLVLSLGWNGAMERVARMTPEDKKHYLSPSK